MPATPLDVVAVGNAIVDVLAHADDAFLAAQGVTKGIMQLVDEARSDELYGAMAAAVEVSGGSAANTAVGVASFGGTAGFIGKVRDDQLGAVFTHDIRAMGVEFDVAPAASGPATARSLVLVTGDADRSMNTYLGAAATLHPDDVDPALIARAKVVFCEGYLWDVDDAKAAIRKAIELAHAAGAKVAFTLSDPFCVDRHRGEFAELARGHIDILFANEEELGSLYELDDFDAAVARVRNECELTFITRSERGSLVVSPGGTEVIAVHGRPAVVDTTGAGDLYAAGALVGLTAGYDLATSGRLGSLAASEVIGHVGARPDVSLRALAAEVLDAAER